MLHKSTGNLRTPLLNYLMVLVVKEENMSVNVINWEMVVNTEFLFLLQRLQICYKNTSYEAFSTRRLLLFSTEYSSVVCICMHRLLQCINFVNKVCI